MTRYLIPCLYMLDGKAVTGFGHKNLSGSGDLLELTAFFCNNGADKIIVFDFSNTDSEHDRAIEDLRQICEVSEIPVIAAGNVKRTEDVKKLIYAGASCVVLNGSKKENIDIMKEVSDRFGKKKICVSISETEEFDRNKDIIDKYAGSILLLDNIEEQLSQKTKLPILLHTNHGSEEHVLKLFASGCVSGVSGEYVSLKTTDLNALKIKGKKAGIHMNIPESRISWKEFKLDKDGLVPVIVQDYRTDEILMMAYMNEESFDRTLSTGKMTYFSRSRQALWTKGETSGHFQYMKSLTIDCDKDTILAKVSQIGAACHTGNRSCFFTPLVKKEYQDANPYHVFENVYNVITDRREHPKEGSYTNYLFDKGIDKILKKVGEENTEIIIAAKNPDPEEIKYEISDYLYHLMVLMADKGVTWDDVTRELARR